MIGTVLYNQNYIRKCQRQPLGIQRMGSCNRFMSSSSKVFSSRLTSEMHKGRLFSKIPPQSDSVCKDTIFYYTYLQQPSHFQNTSCRNCISGLDLRVASAGLNCRCSAWKFTANHPPAKKRVLQYPLKICPSRNLLKVFFCLSSVHVILNSASLHILSCLQLVPVHLRLLWGHALPQNTSV